MAIRKTALFFNIVVTNWSIVAKKITVTITPFATDLQNLLLKTKFIVSFTLILILSFILSFSLV